MAVLQSSLRAAWRRVLLTFPLQVCETPVPHSIQTPKKGKVTFRGQKHHFQEPILTQWQSLDQTPGWWVSERLPSFNLYLRWFLVGTKGFPGGAGGKEPAGQCRGHRDAGSIPGLGRSPGESNATRFSILVWRIPIDRGARRATAQRVAKSWTQLNWLSTHWMWMLMWGLSLSFIVFTDSQPYWATSHCFLGWSHWDKDSLCLNWTPEKWRKAPWMD